MKKLFLVMGWLAVVSVARGESMRPLLTRENRFPEAGRAEVGMLVQYIEYGDEGEAGRLGDSDEWALTPYVRFAPVEGLALYGRLPYRNINPDNASDENGIGDVSVGFEFRAFEDVFGYPYIIPHAEYQFDTGDDEKGLGVGYSSALLGMSIGTVVQDAFHFIVDGSYRVREQEDNVASISGTIIWDVSEELSLLAEATASDDEIGPKKEHPSFFQGGLCYRAGDNLEINIYGGGGKNDPRDVVTGVKVVYSF